MTPLDNSPLIHRIRPTVEPQASQSRQVLGDELCHWIRQRYAWYYERFSG
jgi:hypothetical protein